MAVPSDTDAATGDHLILLPSRPQNQLVWNTDTGRVTKRSQEKNAILAEASWFEALGADTDLAPTYFGMRTGDTWASYELEYLAWPTVSHSMLHTWTNSDLPLFLRELDAFLDRLHIPAPPSYTQDVRRDACRTVFLDKTLSRLSDYEPVAPRQLWRDGISVNGQALPPLSRVRDLLPELVPSSPVLTPSGFRRIHGDLYPGNILYHAADSSIKVVDPRGLFGSRGIYGDPLYDLAKLTHSFVGGFDYLVAGRFQLARDLSELNLELPEETSAVFTAWLPSILEKYRIAPEALSLAHALVLLALPAQHAHNHSRANALAIRGLQAIRTHL